LWNTHEYIHQIDIDAGMKDKHVWSYAKKHDLTIIIKDSDFSNRIMFKEPPPKVIHIRFGNMSMKEFHKTMKEVWSGVLEMNQDYKLVNVYKDKIEGIR
jgi:predicted nuclease of predicted toxin-antitoxin system